MFVSLCVRVFVFVCLLVCVSVFVFLIVSLFSCSLFSAQSFEVKAVAVAE